MGELDHRDYPVAGPIDACHHTATGNNPSRTRPDGNQRRHKAAIARRELERQRTELNPGDEVAVLGSSRTTSSMSGWTTQTVSASTARPVGFCPPTGNRPTTRLERGSICTTSRSRHAPTDRVPAPSSSGPPPWPTSICAVTQRFGRTEPWGGARIVASVGRGWEAGSSGLMRPTTASTATAPSTAALTRSLSCREAMDRPRSLPARREPSAARHPAARAVSLLPTRPS